MIEKLSFKKKVLPSVMAIGLACGMAFSGSAHAIRVAANGVGQVLIAPFYLTKYSSDDAGAGSRNLLTVINTSNTHAVKVKAVFRSRKYCKELLDFLLILSPADVWRGEIYYNTTTKRVQIKSSDDSIRNLPLSDSFANLKQVDFNLFENNLSGYPGDDPLMGHIEFIGHYTATGAIKFRDKKNNQQEILVKRGMSKTSLAPLFETTVAKIVSENSGCPQIGAASQIGILNSGCPVRLNDTANFKIRGNVEVIVPGGARMGYQMTALTASNATNLVIGNPNLSIDVSTETALGDGWGFNTTTGAAFDNILDIEKALATLTASGSYENGFTYEGDSGLTRYTGLQVTFPTKYRHQLGDVCATRKGIDHSKGQFYPPFTPNGDVTFQSVSYDNRENLTPGSTVIIDVPEPSVSGGGESDEVAAIVRVDVITDCSNMLFGSSTASLFTFDSGAYRMSLNASTGGVQPCPYEGVPAIVQTYKFTVDGSGNVQNHMLIPASSDGWATECTQCTP